eukprot:SM000247S08303  [mRNA]  locus=s247:132591:136703:- [translate_table: standard]
MIRESEVSEVGLASNLLDGPARVMSGNQAELERLYDSTSLLSLPLDLVASILGRLQISDRLALLCVSRRGHSNFSVLPIVWWLIKQPPASRPPRTAQT